MAEKDLAVEDDNLDLAVYGLPRISISRTAILVTVRGDDLARYPGHDLLLRYGWFFVKMIGLTRLTEAAMSFGPKPYYWPTDADYGSSPPLATRAGWMALGLLPFVLALSAKANLISALTGIPSPPPTPTKKPTRNCPHPRSPPRGPSALTCTGTSGRISLASWRGLWPWHMPRGITRGRNSGLGCWPVGPRRCCTIPEMQLLWRRKGACGVRLRRCFFIQGLLSECLWL